MRIAVWHNLPSGGGKRVLFDQVGGLVARGHHVEAWCPPSADRSFLPLGELVTEHVVPLRVRSHRRLTAHEILDDELDAVRDMEHHSGACAVEIESSGFDVLLAGTCRYFHAPGIGRHSRIPRILYLQEPCRPLYEAGYGRPILWSARPRQQGWTRRPWGSLRHRVGDALHIRTMRLRARYERDSAAAYDRILVNSLYSCESIQRAYGLTPTLCRLGVDLDRFSPDSQVGREPYLLSVGAMVPHKGAEFVVRAIALQTEPRLPLIWIANAVMDEFATHLERLARSLGVDYRLLVGVSEAELVNHLRRAALFVYAPYLEPLGLAPLEAAACGLPTVAVAEGGVRETVIDGVAGRLVTRSLKDFASAVDTLLSTDLATLRQSARAHVVAEWPLSKAIDMLERHIIDCVSAQ